jgi:hypothetical protein
MKKLFKLPISEALPTFVRDLDDGVVAIAYSKETGDLLSANFADRSVRFCLKDDRILFRVPRPGKPNGLCVSADGFSAIVRDDLGRVAWEVGIVTTVVRPLAGKRGVDAFSGRYKQDDVPVDRMNGICQIPGAVLVTADDSHCLFAVCEDSAVRLVGGNGTRGFSIAPSLQTSMLDSPGGVCVMSNKLLCVCDSGNAAIRVVNPSGMGHVRVFGNPMQKSKSDGDAATARMVRPEGICAIDGKAAFIDCGNSIRLLDPNAQLLRTLYESKGRIGSVACSQNEIYFTESA